jgi:hypothetical protein
MFSFLYHCQDFLPDSDDCIYEQRGERIIGTETSKPSRGPELTSTPIWCGSVLLIILVFCAVLLCVCTSWISCCDVRYDFHMKTTFGSSLPPVVCMRDHVLFTLFVYARRVAHIYSRRSPVKSLGSDRGKNTFKYKVKDPLSFEIWIFCNGQQDCGDDHRMFVALSLYQ